MKRTIISVLLALCMITTTLLGLTSCGKNKDKGDGNNNTVPTPTKLAAPVVTLTDNVASWGADAKADKFEISLDGSLSYVENSITTKTLTHGQTFKIRAVGDGTASLTSDWSNSVTYTAPADPNPNPNPNPDPGTNPDPSQPVKLSAPTVSISPMGLASWSAVANASGYVYKINGGTETSASATSVQLTSGDSITVKAIGDGVNYADSDYSAAKTYTASVPDPSGAPTYLGIFASNLQPSQADGLPNVFLSPTAQSRRMLRAVSYRSFGTALREYFENSGNHFNANVPEASDYDVYSRPEATVYVQIWLNNPSQYTILSLKLNGTKYQVGGGLSSFFINKDGQNYNCVYVAVTIPSGTYTETTYTVTDIEYISNTYINADGTDEFMNNNDTVSIGLPYNAQNPTISDFNPTSLTINSCSATLNVADANGLLNLTGGWLGIAIYDGYNIVANQSLAIGSNSVSATGLVENTYYWITVYLYADLHDGNGVTAHILFEQSIHTPSAITVDEVSGTLLYNSEKDGYYGGVKVNTTLNSNTAEYIKLEILKEDEVVYTDTNFNGTATVSEGILCGNSYRVRVYYKDTEYPEGKYIEESAWINYLGTPWYNEADVYTFVDDAVYYFRINNGDSNYPAIDSLVLKLYSEESARWYASDVLYILDNPDAIKELQDRIDILWNEFNEAYGNFDLMNQIHAEISELQSTLDPLEDALWYLENRADNNRDRAYWADEAAKGKYFYEFEYNGTNTDKIFKVGQTYYVILDDVITYGYDYLKLQIDYKYDKMEGTGLTDGKVNESISIRRELTDHWVEMENVSYSDGKLTLTLFNERDHWTGIGAPYAIGYVYKVEVDGKVLYIDESKHEFDIDETAWFNEYIQLIKAGQSVDGLMEKYVSDYESSYTIPVDATKLEAGNRNFAVSIRLIGTDYEDGDCQATRWAYSVAVYTQIVKPTIEFKEIFGQYYGVVTPEKIENWYNDHYEYEAIDKDGNPVEIRIASEAGYARFYVPAVGTRVRVKIPGSGYWLESEWSEWYTFEGVKLAAPSFHDYDTEKCKIGWTADTSSVSHYIYTVNGGTPVRIATDGYLYVALNNGDVLRVMCVASEEGVTNGYLDSDWAEYTCTDTREALATPTNITVNGTTITWDEVTGATGYYVEYVLSDGRVIESQVGKTSARAIPNAVSVRIRAMTSDSENYRPSAYSESIAITNEKG